MSELQQVVEIFKTEASMLLAWGISISFIATGIALFMKSVIERWVSYYQFMSNKRLGIGVKVEVRGKMGKISDYTRKWIFIRCEDGNDIIIPIKNWLSEKWTLLNNGEDE